MRDDLGARMKDYYEQIPKIRLMRRTPVIVRVDGKAFHTFTKGFVKPFDEVLMKSMQETAKSLCENVMNCRLAYVQSDEISLLLIDYESVGSQAFFDYEIQKICSITASAATLAFNSAFRKNAEACAEQMSSKEADPNPADGRFSIPTDSESRRKYEAVLRRAAEKGAMFDSRAFNVPKEEAANYFYWRQLDAARNSVQMVGHANFTQKELHGKSCSDIQDMLHERRGINWNDFPAYQKRGACCVRTEKKVSFEGREIVRHEWTIDREIPMFKGEGREYVERFVFVGND